MTTITPITPKRVVNFAKLLPMSSHAQVKPVMALTRSGNHEVARRRSSAAVAAIRRSRLVSPGSLRTMPSVTRSVPRVSGTVMPLAGVSYLDSIGVADLALPLGASRFVSAATLKKMLRADRSEVLLRKKGDAWEVCPDSMRVDLADDSVEFRLGAVQIYS